MVLTHKQAGSTIITLLPNRSASWAQTRLFMLLLAGTTLAVGLLWAIAGAWMVLPFSGIEATLACYIIYRVCQRTYQRQVVTCRDDSIVVENGARFPQRRWQFSRANSKLVVTEPHNPMDIAELSIFDQSNRVELGTFLNQTDKQEALDELRRAGLQVRVYDKSTTTI